MTKCIGCSTKKPRNKRADLCKDCFDYYTNGSEQDVKKAV